MISKLNAAGQSVWLDALDRKMIDSGELARLVHEEGITGLTSNPSIFEKAIDHSDDYDGKIRSLLDEADRDALALYEQLAVDDVADASRILEPVYQKTDGRDGFASLEVSPYLATDAEGTINEALRLWERLARPNVMIKVPGTHAGVSALEELIFRGVNVNVTLLFSRDMYERIAHAYLRGLRRRLDAGLPLNRIASVASFFVSRIDTLVDRWIVERAGADLRARLEGKIAIANAKLAYMIFQGISGSKEWKELEARGAHPQRLLWASTGVKNPRYPDTLYVDGLIGRETITTVPRATLEAFRDHGKVRETLTENVDQARQQLAELERAGISLEKATDELLVRAIELFSDPMDRLLASLERKRRARIKPPLNRMSAQMPFALSAAVGATLEDWRRHGKLRRLFARDATLWTNHDESRWLDWIDLVPEQISRASDFAVFAGQLRRDGVRDVVVLGMGGSSLAPEVFCETFDPGNGSPDLWILDSTDPSQIAGVEEKLDLDRTLFIVSSKSGTTLEPNFLFAYFWEKVQAKAGAKKAGRRFAAITDPGSALEKLAKDRGFRAIFKGLPGVGGRYSALSDFGLVPAAAMGIDVEDLLRRAMPMVRACGPGVPPEENPGCLLGAILGTLNRHGRDKVTIISSRELWDLSSWMEQLLAESTGKQGKGIIPVADEEVGDPDTYGDDRLFVYLKLEGGPEHELDAKIARLIEAEQPVLTIEVHGTRSLAQEFYRWECATAIAGAILELNPFDQPDVEAAKVEARKLTAAYERTGSLPKETPFYEEDCIQLFADAKNQEALRASGAKTLDEYVAAHIARLRPGDYFALLAFVDHELALEDRLQEIRALVRERKHVATCLGFGPRFLHSTGQVYKGGPNSGVFFQFTSSFGPKLEVPGHAIDFGAVKMAQARGDFEVLAQRGRRLLRLHSPGNPEGSLTRLLQAVRKAMVPGTATAGKKRSSAA